VSPISSCAPKVNGTGSRGSLFFARRLPLVLDLDRNYTQKNEGVALLILCSVPPGLDKLPASEQKWSAQGQLVKLDRFIYEFYL
jgi:hypothetical protein